jgi:hypothetical protein
MHHAGIGGVGASEQKLVLAAVLLASSCVWQRAMNGAGRLVRGVTVKAPIWHRTWLCWRVGNGFGGYVFEQQRNSIALLRQQNGHEAVIQARCGAVPHEA